ncbi:response regulator [Novosphingobium fuchskuhlense]|uniref:response regulator n=1 Tax=Novosphingobium fuchskuhlense TaxID=1117702 RepID=UPI000AF8F01C|nr:response regulator [Novosphingobium fuchskuhlense]
MFEKLFSYRQIRELERSQTFASLKSDRDRRGLVPIAVIDDEAFAAQQTLTNNGYNIKALGDIKTLDEVEPYNIILCDLQGVGRHLDGKNQGAFLINEIKRNSPEKFVIAYTGGALSDDITARANETADSFLRKDADVQEWRDKLDDYIERVSNPIIVWRRQRDALVRKNVATLDILKLEDAFVKSVQKRDPEIFGRISGSYDIKDDARAIAQSLIASGIFKLLVG